MKLSKIKYPKKKLKTICYNVFGTLLNLDDDDSKMLCNQAKLAYNISTEDGVIKPGYGFSQLHIPLSYSTTEEMIVDWGETEKHKVWHFKYYDEVNDVSAHRIFWTSSSGKVSYCALNSVSPSCIDLTSIPVSSEEPIGINYRYNNIDYFLFSYSTGLYKITQNHVQEINTQLPKFVSLCNAYNKMFGILEGARLEIFYSGILDPTNWTLDESTIKLTSERGPCNKLIFFNDYLYVFRDFGITRISQYSGSYAKFSIEELFLTSGKIYSETVVKCGDIIMFLAKDGIYSFNGTTTQKLDFKFENDVIDNDNAVAAYNRNKYFLAFKVPIFDGDLIGCEALLQQNYKNNLLLIYNVKTKHMDLTRGLDIRSLISINYNRITRLVATFNQDNKTQLGVVKKIGRMFNVPFAGSWVSPKSDLGSPLKTKIIKEIIFETDHDFTITIITDSISRTYNVVAGIGRQIIKTRLKGKMIQLKIGVQVVAHERFVIKPITLVYEEVDK